MDEASARMLTSLNRPGGAGGQLGRGLDGIEEVVGSNPIGSTNLFRVQPGHMGHRTLTEPPIRHPVRHAYRSVALYFALLFLSVSSAPSVVKSVPAVRRCAKNARCSRVSDLPRSTTAPIVRDASASSIRTNRHPALFSTAISGTIDTPIPAPTMLNMLLNCPLSNTICGCTRARSQAATAVSRKQCPSRNKRKASVRSSFSETEARFEYL